MSISAISTNTDYQANFANNIPYSDFYNTEGFTATLEETNGSYVQESEQAAQQSAKDLDQAINPDQNEVPVLV